MGFSTSDTSWAYGFLFNTCPYASCFWMGVVSTNPEGCRFLQGSVGGANKIISR